MPRPSMSWEKSSPELIDLFHALAPQNPGVQEKKMFGWPCYFLNGNLFAGLHKQSMIFRLAEADLRAFLKLPGAAEFEPMPGRKMKGYGILADPLAKDRPALAKWMDRALEHATTLPAKSAKPPKTSTARGKRKA